MTTSVDWWTPTAWQTRLDSGNPIWPYDWAVTYRDGQRVPRVALGTSRMVDLEALVWLHVTGPQLRVDLPPPPGPIQTLMIRATVVVLPGSPVQHAITQWRFGYQTAGGFWGLLIDPTGRLTMERGARCDDSSSS